MSGERTYTELYVWCLLLPNYYTRHTKFKPKVRVSRGICLSIQGMYKDCTEAQIVW